jgi:hypothetical protein
MSTDGLEFNTSLENTINKFGRAPGYVDSGQDTDIWDLDQPVWLAPTASRIHAIVSSDAEVTGAQTVRIYGLREWDGVETSEVVTLNGTSPVNTTRSYVIIHRMKMLTWGALGPNIGIIKATAATDDTITAQILAGEGQTQMAIFGVGSRDNAFITGYYASVQKDIAAAQASLMTLMVNPIPDSVTTGFITKHTQNVTTVGTGYFRHPFNPYYKVAGPAIIKIKGNGTTAGMDVSAGFDLILREKSEGIL